MRIATQIDYAGDVRAAADLVASWEGAGVELVFVPEAYGLDAITLLGYLAARTERVQLGPGIIPIYTRTPALIAQTAVGLDVVSGGRAVLGLGASGPQVIEGWHGVPYDRPLARTREVVEICRSVWRREPLVHHGIYELPKTGAGTTGLGKPLKLISHPPRERIPIYLAALGERNVALAAEVAEGWLPILFSPERAGSVWGAALAEGSARRSPELGPLDVVAGGLVSIGAHREGLRDLARPFVALYVGGMGAKGRNFYHDLLVRYGFAGAADAIQERYLAGDRSGAAAAVPAELLAEITLVGERSEVADRLDAWAAAGVTTLLVTPVGPDPIGTLRTLAELAAER